MARREPNGEQCPGGICEGPRLRTASSRHRRQLATVLAITGTFVVVEIIAAFMTGSLALLAEAGHMLTDVGSLGLALFAIWFAERPAGPEKTFGYYRAEILAALVNALLLLFVAGFIFYEAFGRLQEPPEIDTVPMVAVAAVGLLVNVVGVWLLHRSAEESLNMQAAFWEVVSDALSSVGVIAGGLIMLTTGFFLIDPILSVLIGVAILPRTWRLLNRALNVLLEGSPAHINVAEVREAMLRVPGVRDVHDLHIWTITSGFEAMSGHVIASDSANRRALLEELQRLMRDRFSIEHLTVQIEEEEGAPRERHFGE
jgi:cobalt-zinc-cadmium efflux system protein